MDTNSHFVGELLVLFLIGVTDSESDVELRHLLAATIGWNWSN